MAAKKHKKPYLIFNVLDKKNNIHKLNVAGPRASQTSGIYDAAYNTLYQLLRILISF